MLYLKIVLGEWNNSSRDRRELRVAREFGYDILVIASSKTGKSPYRDVVEDFDVIRIPTRRFGYGSVRTLAGHLIGLLMMIREASKLNPHIISGHNYDGVLTGFASTIFKKNRPVFIYDCHEFELYKKKRNPVCFAFVKSLERFVLHLCSVNIMVTDSIANEVRNIYKLKDRPVVVRNVPMRMDLDDEAIRRNREEFLTNLRIDRTGFVVMFHGGYSEGRGIEQAIDAVARMKNVGLVIMGYALDQSYRKELEKRVRERGMSDRVYFKEAVPFDKLYDFVAAADAGIVLTRNTCVNFVYSLPNKLFENIQALTPVIGSNLPEIGAIISKYDIGFSIDPDDIDKLVESLEIMRSDRDLYSHFKENEKKARDILCWQEEKKLLMNALEKIGRGTDGKV